jgi:uncharacterized protein YqiB (DUF1249 family)
MKQPTKKKQEIIEILHSIATMKFSKLMSVIDNDNEETRIASKELELMEYILDIIKQKR